MHRIIIMQAMHNINKDTAARNAATHIIAHSEVINLKLQ